MKKYLAVSLLALCIGQSWAAEPPSAEQSAEWQPAVNLAEAGKAEQKPTTAVAPAPDATKGKDNTVEQPAAATEPRQAPADDSLPAPSPLYRSVESEVMPLTAEELRQLRNMERDKQKALSAPSMTIVPRISTLTVELSPGSSIPLVKTAVNNGSSLTFTDATGAPWPVSKVFTAAPKTDFTVSSMTDGPNVTIQAIRPYAEGNVHVFLKGLSVPIVLNVSSGETDSASNIWTVDSRLDLRIPRRGPNASPLAPPVSRIALHDNVLQAFLDGTPPADAHRLKTSGGIPDTTVWQVGDDLYVRSRAMLMDEFEQTLSSADGMHLWKMTITPYLTFSVMGRSVPLNITLE